MAYVIVSEGLHDQAYSTATCWASTRRTCRPARPRAPPTAPTSWATRDGVREDAGVGRARSPASRPRPSAGWRSSSPPRKPAALHCGYAPGRTAYGEQFHRAAYALARDHRQRRHPRRQLRHQQRRHRPRRHQAPAGRQPIPIGARVASPLLADLLARGKAGGYPADIKMIYSVGGDLFNQVPNVNKMRRGRSSGSSSSWCTTTS